MNDQSFSVTSIPNIKSVKFHDDQSVASNHSLLVYVQYIFGFLKDVELLQSKSDHREQTVT